MVQVSRPGFRVKHSGCRVQGLTSSFQALKLRFQRWPRVCGFTFVGLRCQDYPSNSFNLDTAPRSAKAGKLFGKSVTTFHNVS